MSDAGLQRKNKVCLEDYNYKQDIENRLLMAQFSSTDLEVLEEILYSSISIPIRKLSKSLELEEEQLLPILQKLSKTGLFSFEGDAIVVDKEVRKYFEFQILKFDPDFKPGMEFLQSLMRKVPIHVLPTWYAIPRTSNNIFDSLVEKYLLTPQIFHRYLMDFHANDQTLSLVLKEVYNSPDFKVYATDLIKKFQLTRERFEEILLHLEFNFVCCLNYTKVGDVWEETVAPFHEWKEYLTFLRDTEVKAIADVRKVKRLRPTDFAFIDDLYTILTMAKKQPIKLEVDKSGALLPGQPTFQVIGSKLEGWAGDLSYVQRLVKKLLLLKLADIVDGRLYALEAANDWFEMRSEARAMFLYRHPFNRIESEQIPVHLCTERNIREAEKSILRVLQTGWVYFDEFIRGVIVPLSEESTVMLKRNGKTWKYTLPSYTDEEQMLIRTTVLDWLFEMGIVTVGTSDGRECFCVTPFGQSLFGR